jgi:hypothetical protein
MWPLGLLSHIPCLFYLKLNCPIKVLFIRCEFWTLSMKLNMLVILFQNVKFHDTRGSGPESIYMILKFLTPCYVRIRSYKRYQIHIYTYIGELPMIVIWKKIFYVILFKLQTGRTHKSSIIWSNHNWNILWLCGTIPHHCGYSPTTTTNATAYHWIAKCLCIFILYLISFVCQVCSPLPIYITGTLFIICHLYIKKTPKSFKILYVK